MSSDKYKDLRVSSIKENVASIGDNNGGGGVIVENSITIQDDYMSNDTTTYSGDIEIKNIKGPLVIFFGPSEIGKTVSLITLSRYINSHYDVNPNEDFRSDIGYTKVKENFKKMLTDRDAPDTTGAVNFILLDVTNRSKGGIFCQFLEAPGEHYFNKNSPDDKVYEPYLNQIFESNYRKIYVFFFAFDMFKDDKTNIKYVEKIVDLLQTRVKSKKDRVIILCNKVDLYPHYFRDGKPMISAIKNALYTNEANKALVNYLRNSNHRRIEFVAFSAGKFNSLDLNGKFRKVFTTSHDNYSKSFWNVVFKSIRGGFWW